MGYLRGVFKCKDCFFTPRNTSRQKKSLDFDNSPHVCEPKTSFTYSKRGLYGNVVVWMEVAMRCAHSIQGAAGLGLDVSAET